MKYFSHYELFLNLISFVFSIDKTEQAYFLFRESSTKIQFLYL